MDRVFDLDYYRNIEILHAPKSDSFHFGNLMTCGSIWHCPICAGKISEQRRIELQQGVENWKKQGGQVLLLTLTIPHYTNQRLQPVLDGLSDALRRLTYSKGWRSLSKEIGLYGRIRALETTYGQNGWHPHFHLLLFCYRENNLDQLQEQILTMWQKSCVRASLPEPNFHGVKVDSGELAAKYVGKWGIEHEMTKTHIKKSRSGYSPFDLLRVYLGSSPTGRFLDDHPDEAAVLFQEYGKAFKGKKQLSWSRGLREDLLADLADFSDEEIADSIEPDAELFALVPIEVWKVILRKNLRGQLLEKCRSGKQSLEIYLNEFKDQKSPFPTENQTPLAEC